MRRQLLVLALVGLNLFGSSLTYAQVEESPAATQGSGIRLDSAFNYCDAEDGQNRKCDGDYLTKFLNGVAQQPNNYYLVQAQATFYSPLDAVSLDYPQVDYDPSDLIERTDGNTKVTFLKKDGVIYTVNGYASNGQVKYDEYKPSSTFNVIKELADNDSKIRYTFYSGSRDRIDRIDRILQNTNFMVWDNAKKMNIKDTPKIDKKYGDSTSYQTRNSIAVTVSFSSVNALLIDKIEKNQNLKGINYCLGEGMQYSLKADDPPNSAWRTGGGTKSVQGTIAVDKNYLKVNKGTLALEGMGVGSIRDVGGGIKNSPNDDNVRLDVLVNDCATALQLGKRAGIPLIIDKNNVQQGRDYFFQRVQQTTLANNSTMALIGSADTSPENRLKALLELFKNRNFSGVYIPTPSGGETASNPGGLDLTVPEFKRNGVNIMNSDRFDFSNSEMAVRLESYTVFKLFYTVSRWIINAAGVLILIAWIWVPMQWLFYVLSKSTNIDFIRLTVPFKKYLLGQDYSAFAPKFAKRLTVISGSVILASALIITGAMHGSIVWILNALLDGYLQFAHEDVVMTTN